MKLDKKKFEKDVLEIIKTKTGVVKKIDSFLKEYQPRKSFSFKDPFEVFEKIFENFENYSNYQQRDNLIKVFKKSFGIFKIDKRISKRITETGLEMAGKGLKDKDGRVRQSTYHLLGDMLVFLYDDFREKLKKRLEELIFEEKDKVDLTKIAVLEDIKPSVFKTACLLHERGFEKMLDNEDGFKEQIYFKVLKEFHKNESNFEMEYRFALYDYYHRDDPDFDEEEGEEFFVLSELDREITKTKRENNILEMKMFLEKFQIDFDISKFIEEISHSSEKRSLELQNEGLIKFLRVLNEKKVDENEALKLFSNVINFLPRDFFDGDTPYERFKMEYGYFPDNIPENNNENLIQENDNEAGPVFKVGDVEMTADEYENMLKEMEKIQKGFKSQFNNEILPDFKKVMIQRYGENKGQEIYNTVYVFLERVGGVGFVEYENIRKDFAFEEFPKGGQTHVIEVRSEKDIVEDLKKFVEFVEKKYTLKIGSKIISPF